MSRKAEAVVRGTRRVRAVQDLEARISDGHLTPGDMLPTEHVLARELKISRSTVRVALKELKDKGLVESHWGRGHIVASSVGARSSLMAQTVVVFSGIHSSASDEINRPENMLYAVDVGISDAIQKAGRNRLLIHSDSLKDGANMLLSDHPLGAVVTEFAAMYGPDKNHWDRVLANGVPVVVNSDDARWSGCERVVSDHKAGAYELTQWLLQQGHRRILRLWDTGTLDSYWVKGRNAGYEKAMKEAGVAPLPVVHIKDSKKLDVDPERLYAGVLVEWLSRPEPIDAIMLASDAHAALAAAACRLCGKQANNDVAIVGYDNYWNSQDHDDKDFPGPLATVDRRNYEVGQEMVRLLMDRVSGTLPAKPQCRLIKPRLVILKG